MSVTGDVPAAPIKLIRTELPRRFMFLLDMHPYKVAWGGRYGLKSWSFADALLNLGAAQKLRIVCGREVLKSLADSAHKLLSDRIEALGFGSWYQILENKIRGSNGTEIGYMGLSDQTAESIKSVEAVDIFWVEQGEAVSDKNWQLLLPSIRAKNSEVWVTFNPQMESDPVWQRFIAHPPPGAFVVKSTFEYAQACGYFTDKMEALRVHDLTYYPDDYENIWLGKPRTAIAGAIYAREITEMVEDGRIRPTPYDPRLPVHTIWDLGWNDAMSIIMVQKPSPSALNIVNYLEDSFKRFDEFVEDLNRLRYTWGTDWLPHDGEHKDPKSGTNAKKTLEGLGRRKVKIIQKSGPEARIKAARMLFPRIYIDNTERKRATGYLGAQRLVDCLKRYRRNVPKNTAEPAEPVHDQYSHAADAFGGLAEIADQIRNEGDVPAVTLPGWSNPEPSMGMLG